MLLQVCLYFSVTILKLNFKLIISGGSLMRPNDFTFKRELDQRTKLDCQARYDKLVGLINTVKSCPESRKELNSWDMDFSKDVVKFQTKVLLPNSIVFANKLETANSFGWNNALKNAHHISSIPLRDWLIFFMPRDQRHADEVREIISLSREMKFFVSEPQFIRLNDVRGSNAGIYSQAIKQELQKKRPQMVFCIVPTNAKDTYDAIKKICCLEFGVPSQVLTTNTLGKNKRSVLTKVAIQMSCKLGGEIWGIQMPVRLS